MTQGLDAAAEIMKEIWEVQHRIHFFSAIVEGDSICFVRWDRSRVIVSSWFDFNNYPEILEAFLRGFNALSNSSRGWDTTVNIASPEQRLKYLEELSAFTRRFHAHGQKAPEYLMKALEDKSPTFVVRVIPVYGQAPRHFLIRRPTSFPTKNIRTPFFGTCRRQFTAWDIEAGQFVWLVDHWRPLRYDGSQPFEGHPIVRFNAIIFHLGTDLPQQTITPRGHHLLHGEEELTHHRMAAEHLRSLRDVKNLALLLRILRGILQGLWTLWNSKADYSSGLFLDSTRV